MREGPYFSDDENADGTGWRRTIAHALHFYRPWHAYGENRSFSQQSRPEVNTLRLLPVESGSPKEWGATICE